MPEHWVSRQVSFSVQTSPSSQADVLASLVQPSGLNGLQESVVHRFVSSQFRLPEPTHDPSLHTSDVVQGLSSLQSAVLAVSTQPPGPQLPVVQGFTLLQSVGPPLEQLPASQISPVVQGSPSSQAAVLFVLWQPLTASHTSSVQASPSSQAPPAKVLSQPLIASQLSTVQMSPSLQSSVAPETHSEPVHWSPTVQASPSEHGPVLATFTQPPAELQKSSVQGLPSLQGVVSSPWQSPAPSHWSLLVHSSPSSQAMPLAAAESTHPSRASQLSAVQGSPSSQTRGSVPTHSPRLLQLSTVVQSSSSSQTRVLKSLVQAPSAQPSSVQSLASSHLAVQVLSVQSSDPDSHTPALQISIRVQASPSLHWSPVEGTCEQPSCSSQESTVQGSPSLQSSTAPSCPTAVRGGHGIWSGAIAGVMTLPWASTTAAAPGLWGQ